MNLFWPRPCDVSPIGADNTPAPGASRYTIFIKRLEVIFEPDAVRQQARDVGLVGMQFAHYGRRDGPEVGIGQQVEGLDTGVEPFVDGVDGAVALEVVDRAETAQQDVYPLAVAKVDGQPFVGFGADAGGFGDAAASGDSAGFGGADDGFGADAGGFGDASGDLNAASGDAGGFGDLGGDAGGFGDAGGDFGGAAADGGFGDAGGFGDDAAAGGDFGGDAGGFGDLGGDAGGFGDNSGGFGDAGGDFGGDAGGFGDLGGDTGGDFGSGGFDDMDLAGDDAKQFAQSMQNAGSGNFPKTEALAPEVNETSAKTDDHTPAAPAADLSDVLAQEAPVEDKAQHESHEQPADHSAALPAAVGAGLAAAAAALAQDKAKKEEAAPQEHAERQAPDMSALDAEQPASGEELPLDPQARRARSKQRL